MGEHPERLPSEAADVLFHLLVMLHARGVRVADGMDELARRQSAIGVRAALETALTTRNTQLADFAERIGLEPQDDLPDLVRALEADLQDTYVYPEVFDVLQALRRDGISLALVSNLATPYKEPVASHGLDAFMDAIVYSCNFGYRKPDPAIYQRALNELRVDAAATVMVGDSRKSDVTGPAAAGIRGVHLVTDAEPSAEDECVTSLHGLMTDILR